MAAMDSEEYTYWMAYNRIDPLGEGRRDWFFGMLASVIANTNRKKGSKPFKPNDFIPKFGPPVKQTVEEMKGKLVEIAQHFKDAGSDLVRRVKK